MKIEGDRIILDKSLNNLDKFTLDFINIIEKYTKYVLISGYVAILFGRSRISEDIDIMFPRMDFSSFLIIHKSLMSTFWCLNHEDVKELYDLLMSNHSIRYAHKDKIIPNMEVKFSKNLIDEESLSKAKEVIMKENYWSYRITDRI